MSANECLIDASTRHQIMLQRLSGGSFNKLKPLLESPEEKAARLRNEWCNRAGGVCSLGMTTLTLIYDAMLSGELPTPSKDGE